MEQIYVRLGYRPIRVGWCVRDGNWDDLRAAFRLSYCFWGGIFNPIIAINDEEEARQRIQLFQIDVLFPATEDSTLANFIESFRQLRWPEIERSSPFSPTSQGRTPQLLDSLQCMLRFEDLRQRRRLRPDSEPTLVFWHQLDPLSDVLLAMFGGYPDPSEMDRDYSALMERHLRASALTLDLSSEIPPDLFRRATPSSITRLELRPDLMRHFRPDPNGSGIYFGDVSSFQDLTNFWNLRASGAEILFYDPAYSARFDSLTTAFLEELRGRLRKGWDYIHVWHTREITGDILGNFGEQVARFPLSEIAWNGLNITPQVMVFGDQAGEGLVTTQAGLTARLSIPLFRKPFSDESWTFGQHVIVTLSTVTRDWNDRWTFTPPYLPQLNELYAREMHAVSPRSIRAEPKGIAIIQRVSSNTVALQGLDYEKVVQMVFDEAGLTVRPSDAGLLTRRLIKHMGGLQDCRVFKITGVRELLNRYSETKSFTREAALQCIGPGINRFRDLFIEPPVRPLTDPGPTAQSVFDFLVKKRVLRAGQLLRCPFCNLQEWFSLNELGTACTCEFCGEGFDPTIQLSKNWHYRRSPLCGKPGNRGGIPTTLVLQQLDTAFRGSLWNELMVWTACMEISRKGEEEVLCETDFIAICRQRDNKVAVAVGEVKTNNRIQERDVNNLAIVADTLGNKLGVVPYIFFAKTGTFSVEEVELCKKAQAPFAERVILLEAKHLEPYGIYDWTEDVPEQNRYVTQLSGMSEATTHLYFDGAYLWNDGWHTRE